MDSKKRNTKTYKKLPYNPSLKERAKELRKAGNLSEVLLWQQLKQIKKTDFDRQKIIGNYIVDFYCAAADLVIEVDGNSHDYKTDYDKKRVAYLESCGLTVMRFRDTDIFKNMDNVILYVQEFLDSEISD